MLSFCWILLQEIDDSPPNPNQQPSNPRLAPRAKVRLFIIHFLVPKSSFDLSSAKRRVVLMYSFGTSHKEFDLKLFSSPKATRHSFELHVYYELLIWLEFTNFH